MWQKMQVSTWYLLPLPKVPDIVVIPDPDKKEFGRFI